MRNFILLFIVFFIGQAAYSQVGDSVLSEGVWYKFSVDTTGVFKIDRNLLQEIGISADNVDPRNIQIFGNGGNLLPELVSDFRYNDIQENAIYIEGENDGIFNDEDFILFYAKGPHSWDINTTNGNVTHKQNIYSNKSYYFIRVGSNFGKRIENRTAITGNSLTTITSFNDFIFYERELVNLFAAGRRWVGENFNVENQQSFSLPFPNSVANSNLRITVRGVAISGISSSLDVSLASQNITSLNFNGVTGGSLTRASDVIRTATVNSPGSNLNFSLNYNNNGNPAARGYLDYIEVSGFKNLVVDDFQFSFRSFDAANTNGVVEYQLQTNTNDIEVWDVTESINPKKVVNNSSTGFSFLDNGGSLKEYVVLTNDDFYIPEAENNARVANQNLHSLRDINYLLITTEELAGQAQRMADYYIQNSGITAKVVLLDQIYNEFASGSPDITGVRDFIKYIYDSNTSAAGKLKYVCFFGDSSYDYKGIQSEKPLIPVYESNQSFNLAFSYVTDDYFAMLEANEGTMSPSHTIDIATGRVPVNNVQQASEVVDKILSYYTASSFGDWRNTITLVADDIDATDDIPIQSGVESIADDIKQNKPVYNINKIYADAYVQQNTSGGERYPDVQNAITTAIERGTLVFDYFGHGGEDGFAAERFLDREQVQGFINESTLPLFITVTCEFSRFDNPERVSAGELTFWNTRGGASSMISTTREVFISVGQAFNRDLMGVLLSYNNEELTIAESLMQAKNSSSNFQKFFIYYFGDPAKELAKPKPKVKITKMNGVDVTQSLDTLKALSKVTFEGVVTNENDVVLSDFNGKLFTTVFDKPIDKTTLDNDGFGVNLEFDSQESKLFKGAATIENGAFNFEFIVPKDIRIAYGKGKISFYSENGLLEKSGFNNDIIVGGINENAPEDTVGPEIQLFMNDESFLDGGNTNSSPNLIVKLSDVSGINTSITAVDHDIVAILDGDESNPIVLNDFYETEANDFTTGKAVFRFRDLAEGQHTLKLKAWDTYNNSSEATLTFVVVSDSSLTLDNVLNYPNPFVNYTEFWFNHNKPNEPLEVQVQIFTISGKLVKTINQLVQTSGNLSRNIFWNGLDDFGNRIGKGVYVYKLKVKSTVSNIAAEKYEKLVIL